MKTNSASLTGNTDIVFPTEWWWWERLVLGVWMLAILVLAKSYSGNLMSLLAVRYAPQPFQTPRDVLNDQHVTMIWQKYSKNEEFLRVSVTRYDARMQGDICTYSIIEEVRVSSTNIQVTTRPFYQSVYCYITTS